MWEECRNEGLTFPGYHLSDHAVVKDDSTDELDIVVPHVQKSADRLRGIRRNASTSNIVEGFDLHVFASLKLLRSFLLARRPDRLLEPIFELS